VAAARVAPGQAIRLDARYLEHKFAQGGLRIERWEPLPLPAEQALGIDLLPSALCPYPFLVEMLAEM
jgi:hypothetical protein